MKRFRLAMVGLFALFFVAFSPGHGSESRQFASKQTFSALKSQFPQLQLLSENDRIKRVFGQPFGYGSNPDDAAAQFVRQYATLFGVASDELLPVSWFNKDLRTQQLMYDESSGRYKFTLVYFSQIKNGVPVYRSELRLLVRNEGNYPVVLAVSTLRDLGDFEMTPASSALDPSAVMNSFAPNIPTMPFLSEPELVIWAGKEDENLEPRIGLKFIADNGLPATEKEIFIINPYTNEIIYRENQITFVDVNGQVNGLVTEDFKMESCGLEVSTALPYARVYISGGSTAYADSTGYFVIPNGGSAPVSVISNVRGRWFQVFNNAGSEAQLSQSVTPPGPANFLHNPSNTEYTRAEVNGYVHANIVRDFTLMYNPSYPTIYNQTDWPVYVNDNTLYCPGNAWYDGVSITFCRAGSGYPNTAFSTIVHHEYGHHLVEVAGSGQGAYGEGMGDVMGHLITDNPGAGWGFFGDCNEPLRNADNAMQYPCSGEIHYCGQLLSGCVWSTRNELAAAYPSMYMDILADLVINAILLHTGESIDPSITIDYLTLDDNDGDIGNGTPHYPQICAGFGAHNMDCPPLQTGVFITHTPLDDTPSNSPYQVDATITSTDAAIDSTYIFWSNGGSFNAVQMSSIGGSNYRGYIPGQPNCTTIDYYLYATDAVHNRKRNPETGTHTFFVGPIANLDTLFIDNVEGGVNGWTHYAVTGGFVDEWAIRNHRNHSSGGLYAWKCGSSSSSGDYADYDDAGLVTPQISLGQAASMKFWMWGEIEQSSSTIAWDGGMVEISVNGGTYSQITPVGGYSHVTLGGYGHAWPAATPCWSGTFGWTQKEIDLSSYSGDNVQLRFRFASDNSVVYEGWYIDEIVITSPDCDSIVTGTLAGTVTDNLGNVSNAIVVANDGAGHIGRDTTNTGGSYSITLPVANYSVSFAQIDHRDTSIANVGIVANTTTTLNVVMSRLPGSIKGTVTDGFSNNVNNVRVTVLGPSKEDTTDSNGRYQIYGIVDGTYGMSFDHPDFRDTTVNNVSITPGDTTTLNVALQKLPGWIEGIVRDTSGVPLESVYVQINLSSSLNRIGERNPEGGLIQMANEGSGDDIPIIQAYDSCYTDANGHYIRNIASRTYSVRFSKANYIDSLRSGVVITPNDTTQVSPRLRPVNFAPVITSPSSASATEDIFFSYTATAADPNGNSPVISFANYPAWLSVAGNVISGTPLNGHPSTTFTVFATDGQLWDTLIVSLTVLPVNDPPIITSAAIDTSTEHQSYEYIATASDPDGPQRLVSYGNYPGWLTPVADTISGTPPEGAADTSFRLIVSDGLLADTQTVSLIVLHINNAPQITSPAVATAIEDSAFRYIGTAVDPEGAIPSISYANYASWLSAAGDTLRGITPGGAPDTSFIVVASDGNSSDTLLVNVTVTQTNDAPIITSPDIASAVEDQQFSYTATANDPDGTLPEITFINYAAWLHVNETVIYGTPGELEGDTSFVVIASDGILADTLQVTVTVIHFNDSPIIISPDTAIATIGELFIYTTAAFDPEGATPIISFIEYPQWLTISGNSLVGSPQLGDQDTTFKTIASDGELSDTMEVFIIIGSPCTYLVGDVNGSGVYNGLDVTYMVGYLKGGSAPTIECDCPPHGMLYAQGDVNSSCSFNGLDVTYSVTYFKGGPFPIPCADCPGGNGPILSHPDNGGESSTDK